MLSSDPFLYRSLRPGRQLYRQLLMALVGPLLLELPSQLSQLLRGRANEDQHMLGLLAFVTFLCLRSIAGSVTAVSQERERGSWEVLLASGFRQRDILLGLWRASLLPRLLEVSLSLPWLLSWDEHPWAQFALLLGLATSYTTLGLFASVRCASSLKSMQLAYGWLGLTGVGSFMLWLIGQMDSGVKSVWGTKVLLLNPWAAVLNLEDHFAVEAALVHWFLALVLLGALTRMAVAAPKVRFSRGVRRPALENPLRYRNQFHAPLSQWGLALLYCLLVLGPVYAFPSHNAEPGVALSILAHLGFWLVRATFACCHCFCREREQGSLDALLTSRLKPTEILNGLLAQTLAPLSRQALLLSPLLLLAFKQDLGRWLLLTLLTQVSLWGWGFAAIAASLYFSSTLKSFQATYLALAFVTVGTLTLDITLLDPLLHLNCPLLCMVNPVLSCIYLALQQTNCTSERWWPWAVLATFLFHLALVWWGRRLALRRLGCN